jgi:hypothetical protein
MLIGPVNNNEGRVTPRGSRGPKIRRSTGMLAPGMLAELNQMKFRHVLGLLCAVLISAAPVGTASAQEKAVKIGAIFPMSGNAASTGVHARAALEVAMDIIEMDDTAARQMQGFFVLCDAIDRAGSTDPAKIQAALKATDLKPDQLMMGYKGVKFDDKGQNTLASGLIIQLQDGEDYVAVWPKANAAKAPVMPYKGW